MSTRAVANERHRHNPGAALTKKGIMAVGDPADRTVANHFCAEAGEPLTQQRLYASSLLAGHKERHSVAVLRHFAHSVIEKIDRVGQIVFCEENPFILHVVPEVLSVTMHASCHFSLCTAIARRFARNIDENPSYSFFFSVTMLFSLCVYSTLSCRTIAIRFLSIFRMSIPIAAASNNTNI